MNVEAIPCPFRFAAPLLVVDHCCTADCPQDRIAPDNVDAIVENMEAIPSYNSVPNKLSNLIWSRWPRGESN